MTADVDQALEGPSPQMETLEFPVPKPERQSRQTCPALRSRPTRSGLVRSQHSFFSLRTLLLALPGPVHLAARFRLIERKRSGASESRTRLRGIGVSEVLPPRAAGSRALLTLQPALGLQ